MKKLLSVILSVFILSSAALAEIDLESMSYDELYYLYQRVQVQLMKRNEWKEVTAPVGIWKVGEDIPAGSYSIRASGSMFGNVVLWRGEQNDYKSGVILNEMFIDDENTLIGKVIMSDGNTLEISGCPVILSPVVGLGF